MDYITLVHQLFSMFSMQIISKIYVAVNETDKEKKMK